MAKNTFIPEVTVWTDARHVSLVERLLTTMNTEVKPIGIGGPREPQVDQLAKDLHCHYENDLRKLLVEYPASFLLLMTMEECELDELQTATEHNTVILSLEPDIAGFDALRNLLLPPTASGSLLNPAGKPDLCGNPQLITQIPAFRQSPGMIHAADPYDCLGSQRLINIDSCGTPDTGSLYARLFDAWRTILNFMALPESIDTSILGPFKEVPENIRHLTGSLAAHARSSDGSAVVMSVADRTGYTHRHLNVIGNMGQLLVSDLGYNLRHTNGQEVDQFQSSHEQTDFVELMAFQWRRIIDRPNVWTNENTRHQDAEVLACCQACLLSSRTGQGENPHRILAMNR